MLVRLAENPPIFNYNPLFGAVRDLLVLGVPYEQVVEGIKKIKRADVRENLLGVLPLIRDHFAGVTPDFFQAIERRYYPVGRGLMVPFEPPMIYGVGGQLYFPWFSFWRQNPLADERLSLFAAIVDDVMMQDPDLDSARFEILDFSCLGPKQPRVLRVIDAREIPRIREGRKTEMLEAFAEGYFLAVETLKGQPKASRDERDSNESGRDEDQLRLFD
ncbi:hypothetical protein BwSH20_46090 [Bradyrhizobium ottawaense]|nr:hypothetical protein [Bradyrhizobium sp. CCBAU 65884]GMO15251.1 hypothetical protein BwSH14_03930 [Bradyrhizobium ottawaense]GMO18211.1 hypothetical protein BwSF21_10240 [Bradyrhizobium ottawaense]GMO45699.1 hypothetical protein BwSF12_51340 [Bradyrhizobium ottawaense]GMO75412.1 hypothetical protein BwSH17_39940 [Bradyrhizobium ottawaense]GMO84712.1 hypothetical protein BwSG10_62830 [Bradyrhizobium ottawaense]